MLSSLLQSSSPFHQQVQQSFVSSLQHLSTDYIDSYILHGPYTTSGFGSVDQEVWRSMEELYAAGKIKYLGVSNVSLEQMIELYHFAKIKPRFAQIRTYASRLWEKPLRQFCQKNNIIFQGFSLLTANRNEMKSELIFALAQKYKKTPSQIIFAFARQMEILPLTGTTSLNHMQEDLSSLDISLTISELEQIENISV